MFGFHLSRLFGLCDLVICMFRPVTCSALSVLWSLQSQRAIRSVRPPLTIIMLLCPPVAESCSWGPADGRTQVEYRFQKLINDIISPRKWWQIDQPLSLTSQCGNCISRFPKVCMHCATSCFSAFAHVGIKDMTWYTIKLLESVGLAWDLKYPFLGPVETTFLRFDCHWLLNGFESIGACTSTESTESTSQDMGTSKESSQDEARCDEHVYKKIQEVSSESNVRAASRCHMVPFEWCDNEERSSSLQEAELGRRRSG